VVFYQGAPANSPGKGITTARKSAPPPPLLFSQVPDFFFFFILGLSVLLSRVEDAWLGAYGTLGILPARGIILS